MKTENENRGTATTYLKYWNSDWNFTIHIFDQIGISSSLNFPSFWNISIIVSNYNTLTKYTCTRKLSMCLYIHYFVSNVWSQTLHVRFFLSLMIIYMCYENWKREQRSCNNIFEILKFRLEFYNSHIWSDRNIV